jgi:acyl-CoA thioesterase-1
MLRALIIAAAFVTSAANASPAKPLILAFGDSLTAGYGLDPGLGFAPQLQATLRRLGIAATVADGGVSGDTSAAGKARLAWTLNGLGAKPDLVIVELGANDMLRALDPAETERNLDAILSELERRKLRTLFVGMRGAPNLDPAYVKRLEAIYPRLAKRHGAAFYPFFLEGVATVPGMVQPDGMHPTFKGVQTIVLRITPVVKAELGR